MLSDRIEAKWIDAFCEIFERCAVKAGDTAAILVLTHDHGLDYRLTAAALRSRACFIGLIGSQTKRARFLSR